MSKNGALLTPDSDGGDAALCSPPARAKRGELGERAPVSHQSWGLKRQVPRRGLCKARPQWRFTVMVMAVIGPFESVVPAPTEVLSVSNGNTGRFKSSVAEPTL
ncbi:hypothetical protein AYL99_10198 [Fonsecaea erecta]|uniref:Uncharacterized protein n=1 Tax=Fonsecaea erecta TaxID=1367422 RepID=A0A178Z9C8_9EURO|nr:hypothetical protein AYL99_10198 [Fonsecaea erecta]OAP56046.1 hypothetical protein AYL99_10198 [Fonsecaea erecta]